MTIAIITYAKHDGRCIEWDYTGDKRGANRAFREIVRTGRTHDTGQEVTHGRLLVNGYVQGEFDDRKAG